MLDMYIRCLNLMVFILYYDGSFYLFDYWFRLVCMAIGKILAELKWSEWLRIEGVNV